ncbi:hypothetical protein SAMN02745166_04010 [Prosthecobacter debontii]|uniref:TraB family protein n=1 Tax=Prosthecobacter debontii TaxID=48467 RepID=A0A1T4YR16_9BACT|nr:hypothetical protein [Prosthecobacter debontii]SKB04222.1 hypothetical protein SAMN02745166_04010 [Prosthecobacter debontii]
MKAPRVILMLVAVLTAPLHSAEPAPPTPAPVAIKPVEQGTDFLRFVEGDDKDVLQTAIVRYVSPAGVPVDLVGAVHIADKAYFDALNARFKTYDAVLYELVGRPIEERDTLKPGDGSEKLQWLGQVQEMMRNTLKLESQLQCIDYKAANFVHADMSLEGFFDAQDQKKETFLTLWVKAMQAQSGLQRDHEQPSMLELIMILRQEDSSTELKRLVGREFDSMEKLITGIESTGSTSIIGERNKHALSVMEREIQAGKKRLAIFYGAAHLPDMEQRLIQCGFKLQNVDWVTAWNLPWSEE